MPPDPAIESTRRILFPIAGTTVSQRALDTALRIARRESATLVAAYLAVVPLYLPLDTGLEGDRRNAMPMLDAIEEKAGRDGVPLDSRLEAGRTHRHALERLYDEERFDRTVVEAGEGLLTDDIAWLLARAPGEVVVLRPPRAA